ncbi:uncharacterized protein LOC131688592 [Topomyia yanbarensis]|uniref:uncharacterized protein LOC131688592 n=1 Tax=Topomyia yanbarensis TaxID=2498891 RepID=UPI00273AE397|nr:uncharacterized protein LOC131688592 [Topomyia yanbarensis]
MVIFDKKLILLILCLVAACAYPQELSAEQEEKPLVEESAPKPVPKIFNIPPDVEVNFQPGQGPIRPEESQQPQKGDLATAESVVHYYYYPGAYYYPLRYRWNPYYYSSYYWWL